MVYAELRLQMVENTVVFQGGADFLLNLHFTLIGKHIWCETDNRLCAVGVLRLV